jgi:hypothetical protein
MDYAASLASFVSDLKAGFMADYSKHDIAESQTWLKKFGAEIGTFNQGKFRKELAIKGDKSITKIGGFAPRRGTDRGYFTCKIGVASRIEEKRENISCKV